MVDTNNELQAVAATSAASPHHHTATQHAPSKAAPPQLVQPVTGPHGAGPDHSGPAPSAAPSPQLVQPVTGGGSTDGPAHPGTKPPPSNGDPYMAPPTGPRVPATPQPAPTTPQPHSEPEPLVNPVTGPHHKKLNPKTDASIDTGGAAHLAELGVKDLGKSLAGFMVGKGVAVADSSAPIIGDMGAAKPGRSV